MVSDRCPRGAEARRDRGRRRPGEPAAGVVGAGGPRRTCIGCRRVAATDDMVRVVRNEDGLLIQSRCEPGRGAWLCADSPQCVDEAERRGAFSRALRGPVSAAGVASLRKYQSERARIEGCGIRSRKG